jgi:hypothetical protein
MRNIIEEYSSDLLDLTSEYDEGILQKWISDGNNIQAIVFLHRHICAQLKYLIIKYYANKKKLSKSSEIIDLIDRIDDSDLYKLSFLNEILSKNMIGKLKGLNKLRNNYVHPSQDRHKYVSGNISSILREASSVEKELARLIDNELKTKVI